MILDISELNLYQENFVFFRFIREDDILICWKIGLVICIKIYFLRDDKEILFLFVIRQEILENFFVENN